MKAFSFIGRSGSGKTRLITRLIPVLNKRGHAVAVIKHCPHGFSLDREDTDSGRFAKTGAYGVGLISSRKTAVLQRTKKTPDFRALAKRHFPGADIILIEGGRAEKGIPKIEVVGANEKLRPVGKGDDRIAAVSGRDVDFAKPVFRPSQVSELAAFLESI